jgi:hypothetical protein
MDYEKATNLTRTSGNRYSFRVMIWQLVASGRRRPGRLDPRFLSDHMLTDIGLERPKEPWEETRPGGQLSPGRGPSSSRRNVL